MYNNYDYPCGTDEPNAPWNQVDNPEREIEVTVSITLSKTVKIKVSDYEITDSGKDEDGEYFEDIDYSNCNLESAVKEQLYLPNEAGYLFNICLEEKQLPTRDKINDLSNWNIDDFVCNLEE